MSRLDDRLRRATDELRDSVDDLAVGPFSPNRRNAPIVVAGLASVLAIVLVAWLALPRPDDGANELLVATRPEDPSPEPVLEPASTGTPVPTPMATASPDSARVTQDAVAEAIPGRGSREATSSDDPGTPATGPDRDSNIAGESATGDTDDSNAADDPAGFDRSGDPDRDDAGDSSGAAGPGNAADSPDADEIGGDPDRPGDSPGTDSSTDSGQAGEATPTPPGLLPPPAPTATPEPTPTRPPQPGGPPLVGRLSQAGAGEYLVPAPGTSAWNSDSSRVLLYRTGAAEPAHVVFDSATGETLAVTDLNPPDIEQVYWDPTDPGRLLLIEGVDLVAYDIATQRRQALYRFAGCDQVDAGYPSPPSRTGTIVAFCDGDIDGRAGRQVVAFDIATGVETRGSIQPDGTEYTGVQISPSGQSILVGDDAGMVHVYDTDLSDRGVDLDTGGDVYGFVIGPDGREQIAAVQFDGPIVGSVVLLALDGAAPQVIVGPDRGHEYPPGGVQLSTAGSRIVFSTRGPPSGELGGRIVTVDLSRIGDEIVSIIDHDSAAGHGYWSEVFVSISPDGRHIVHSTDSGSDRVDTWVSEFPG